MTSSLAGVQDTFDALIDILDDSIYEDNHSPVPRNRREGRREGVNGECDLKEKAKFLLSKEV
tara:strand:+ start:1462 stop:1647 length:186 start_codon:yes stop_codon:yes gene_type:complete